MRFAETDDAMEDFLPSPPKPKSFISTNTGVFETDLDFTEFTPPPPEPIPPERSLSSVLTQVGVRSNQVTQADKKNYSERLSRGLAQLVANSLRAHFTVVTPSQDGRCQETVLALPDGKTKRVDVMARDHLLRLVGSIKTISFADALTGRFTKNVVNRANDLLAEAWALQGMCPTVGLFFLPAEACWDGERSSFAHAIHTLRDHRFTAMLVGVYDHEVDRHGYVRFSPVERHVPNRGLPALSSTWSYDELVSEILRLAGVEKST